ncbi:hypothetical protein [Novosphingobium umbonatum]|uniref:hypothetical protein n=1 Tax=Novosphingobium umbonatum TaxID=1908524 RepID=UPI001C708702|nr:hypothetical protein [Novosphingobium umbonatum]
MSKKRDDFSAQTKRDMALRASYHCSLCKRSTVGPGEEGPSAITLIGVAAHISAAASGPGARRYDPTITSEQRSHIDNGIWLCASCATLVDRDQIRFTADDLRKAKRDHESSRRIGVPSATDEGDIIAIGPDIIVLGCVIRSSPEATRIRVSHFVNGSIRDLWSLTRIFETWPAERRYVLLNELGYGALLAEPPVIERVDHACEVEFKLLEQTERQQATTEIAAMCRETGKLIKGLAAHIQNFECILGMAQGTFFADLTSGSDLSDLYWRYKESPWFARLAKMEMIRLSSIAPAKRRRGSDRAPFCIVNQVNRVDVPNFDLTDQKLKIDVEFELEGLGAWKHTLVVFVSTPEQLIECRENALKHNKRIKGIQNQSIL